MRLGGVKKKNKLSLPLSVHHVSWLLLGFVFCLAESPAPAVAVASLSLRGRMLHSLLSQSGGVQPYFSPDTLHTSVLLSLLTLT